MMVDLVIAIAKLFDEGIWIDVFGEGHLEERGSSRDR